MKHSLKVLSTAAIIFTGITSDAISIGDIPPFQGAKMAGRAGVGAAFPDDATSGNINPALMALVGNVISLDPGVQISRQTQDYLVPAIPPIIFGGVPIFPGVNVRALGPQKNKYKAVPFLFGGVNYQLNCKWSIGVSLTEVDNAFVKYKNNFVVPSSAAPAPILAAIVPQSGPGNTSVKTFSPQLNTIIAWKPNDRQAYAVSFIVGYRYFKSNLLNPTTGARNPFSGLVDNTFGAGIKLGGYWKLMPCLDLGLSVGTPVFYQRIKNYRTLFPHAPHNPWNGVVGLAWHVTPKTTLGFDVEAQLTNVSKFYGNKAPNGLGWRSAVNYKFGVQQKILCNLIGRLGYTYGKTPVKNQSVFINGFINPGIYTEHMIGAGFTYAVTPKFDIDLAGNYFFKKTLTDNGRNTPNGVSKGMKLSGQVGTIMLGFNYKY